MALYIISLIAALVGTALGQLNFKLFFVKNRCWTNMIAAAAFFCAVPFCSYFALRQLSVGLVYMCTSVTQLMVLGLSHYILKEKLTKNHVIALTLIIAGILIYAW
ncbi:MAG: EamA family transporter [Planctomycetota bacterium]|jgi:drug/metabolite transporter (DMT)-like permease